MRFSSAALAVTGLAALSTALPSLPIRFGTTSSGIAKRDATPAADIVLAIAPKSGDCTNAPFADECATNVQAARPLVDAMAAYGIYNPAQIAAVLSVMAFESGDFKYNKNHNPGRAGQGTRNMQLIKYNVLFARSKDELKDKVPEGDADSMTDDQKNAVLALVMADPYNYETGPWFLATQCEQSVRDTLASNPDAGWAAYMRCINVASTDDRTAYWTRAKAAFGLA